MGALRWLSPLHTEMDEADLRDIVEAGERVIRKVGMRIDGTDEFFGRLRDFGCEIDGMRVGFPGAVVDKTMARIAERKRGVGGKLSVRKEALLHRPAHHGGQDAGRAEHGDDSVV